MSFGWLGLLSYKLKAKMMELFTWGRIYGPLTLEGMSSCFPHFPVVSFDVVRNKSLWRSSDAKFWGLTYLYLTGRASLSTNFIQYLIFLFIVEEKHLFSFPLLIILWNWMWLFPENFFSTLERIDMSIQMQSGENSGSALKFIPYAVLGESPDVSFPSLVNINKGIKIFILYFEGLL